MLHGSVSGRAVVVGGSVSASVFECAAILDDPYVRKKITSITVDSCVRKTHQLEKRVDKKQLQHSNNYNAAIVAAAPGETNSILCESDYARLGCVQTMQVHSLHSHQNGGRKTENSRE